MHEYIAPCVGSWVISPPHTIHKHTHSFPVCFAETE